MLNREIHLSPSEEKKTVKKLLQEVFKDKEFYRRIGGGLTLSGGEIFAQFEDL